MRYAVKICGRFVISRLITVLRGADRQTNKETRVNSDASVYIGGICFSRLLFSSPLTQQV